MGATGIEPMTSTVSSTLEALTNKGFSGLGAQESAKPRKKSVIPHPGRTRGSKTESRFRALNPPALGAKKFGESHKTGRAGRPTIGLGGQF
jgi:hypothetical protein